MYVRFVKQNKISRSNKFMKSLSWYIKKKFVKINLGSRESFAQRNIFNERKIVNHNGKTQNKEIT